MKKIILLATTLLLLIILFVGNYREEGTFKELVLDKYVAKEFDKIVIHDKDAVGKADKSIDKINQVISNFNEYNFTKRNKYKENKDIPHYIISLYNHDTGEYIQVIPLDVNLMQITMKTLSIIEDKENKTTNYKHSKTRNIYKITNKSIDFDYLSDLYNSLSETYN